jgi:hypothetical protein
MFFCSFLHEFCKRFNELIWPQVIQSAPNSAQLPLVTFQGIFYSASQNSMLFPRSEPLSIIIIIIIKKLRIYISSDGNG